MATPRTPTTPHTTGHATVEHTRIMGAPMGLVTEARAVHDIVSAAERGQGHWTITANLDHLRHRHSEPLARELIEDADMVVADGMPLIWASRVAGQPLPERVAGSSMVWSICEIARAREQSIFLLGGDPGIAQRAATVFQDRYPGLQVAGTACPSKGFERDELELNRIQRQITEAAPHIVFVALGFPKQDRLINRLRQGRIPIGRLDACGTGLVGPTGIGPKRSPTPPGSASASVSATPPATSQRPRTGSAASAWSGPTASRTNPDASSRDATCATGSRSASS